MTPPTDAECRQAVLEALESLPSEFADRVGSVAVIVEESHPDRLMGIYDPVGGVDRIVIFRDANPTIAEVKKTVLHEIGHHFGMDEDQLERAGYG